MHKYILIYKDKKSQSKTYYETRKFLTDCKKNWKEQIEELPDCEKRDTLIDMYFNTKITKVDK